METDELMRVVARILAQAKTAVLATADAAGRPHVRWMTPTILKGRPGAIYAVASRQSGKFAQLSEDPHVEWMFQTPALDEIVTLRGRINLVDTPSLKAEIIEAIGHRLHVFWKAGGAEEGQFVVLETIPETATYLVPMKGRRETVSFE